MREVENFTHAVNRQRKPVLTEPEYHAGTIGRAFFADLAADSLSQAALLIFQQFLK